MMDDPQNTELSSGSVSKEQLTFSARRLGGHDSDENGNLAGRVESVESSFDSFRTEINSKFDSFSEKLFKSLENRFAGNFGQPTSQASRPLVRIPDSPEYRPRQSTGRSAARISDYNKDDGPHGSRVPCDDSSHRIRDGDPDALSIHPGQNEVIGRGSDDGHNDDNDDHSGHHSRSKSEHRSSPSVLSGHNEGMRSSYERFCNPLTPSILNDILGPGNNTNPDVGEGLVLHDRQKETLSKTWRSQDPVNVVAVRSENKKQLKVQKDSEEFLKVPQLDKMIEIPMQKFHKTTKSWENGKKPCLFSQPLKYIEQQGYNGQMASRMNIIAISYLQQGLWSLLADLRDNNVNLDRAYQTAKDLHELSDIALDQAGRSGVFHHLVRRKAAAVDAGFEENLKDIAPSIPNLKLSGEGVLGPAFKEKIKDRKDLQEMFTELLPDFQPKRKAPSGKATSNIPYKIPKLDHQNVQRERPTAPPGGRYQTNTGYTQSRQSNRPPSDGTNRRGQGHHGGQGHHRNSKYKEGKNQFPAFPASNRKN